ncbi:conserved hypothetical protein, partial [Ixodes scapularis]
LRAMAARCCSASSLATALDVLVLLVVLVFQGSTLDFYLIRSNEGSVAWYFWFLADFLSGEFSRAIQSWVPCPPAFVQAQREEDAPQEDCPHPVWGRFPLCYVSWLLYSLLLVAKVVLLFRLDVAQLLEENARYGVQFLKAVVAAAAVVFLLLVEGHHDAASQSEQRTYLRSLSTGTTFELLDSVTFLGLLFPNETHLTLTYPLENAVLALACVNFVLPGLALFKLSQCEYGLRPRPLGLKLLYKLLHLSLVNVPYLAIRVYLWGFFGHDVSLFIVKNLLGIYAGIRALVPDLRLYCFLLSERGARKRVGDAEARDPIELKVM